MSDWHVKNAERVRENFRRWQSEHREERRLYKRQWSRSHPESVKLSNKNSMTKTEKRGVNMISDQSRFPIMLSMGKHS